MVELGDEVKDLVSGIVGIAVTRHQYLQGCDRITIQPAVKKDNCYVDCQTFDEPQLKIIKKQKLNPEEVRTQGDPGGEDKYIIKQKL